jgi:hypothetical protein
MGFPANESMSGQMKDTPDHIHALRSAQPIRVCLMGLLIFAIAHRDHELVSVINCIMGDMPDDPVCDAPLDLRLSDALRRAVAEDELMWWLQSEELALTCQSHRAVYHRLAELRLRSED